MRTVHHSSESVRNHPGRRTHGLLSGLMPVVLALLSLGTVSAQPPERVLGNPGEVLLHGRGGARLAEGPAPTQDHPDEAQSRPGEKFLDLSITYTDSTIFNPSTGERDNVRLRSYTDANRRRPTSTPFVAPTIAVAPGDTVRISLTNRLPLEPGCRGSDMNVPHCFNTTNLHSHGLWVSPTGNSDNVFLTIRPAVKFQYEYNIPVDHPSGTFWYHPHVHGSTAVQVASGMAGVLIVRGARPPTGASPGDVDILLKAADGTPLEERVLLLQQIPYACRNPDRSIMTNPDGTWACDGKGVGDAAVGKIEPWNFDILDRANWVKSGRYTSINGDTFPLFVGARVGQPERWRIVHAGVRASVKLEIRKMQPSAGDPGWKAALDSKEAERWLDTNCVGENLTQFALASDGLTRGQIVERDTSVLQPGYREDLLLVFPEAGDYCIIDDQAQDSAGNVGNRVESRKYLGRIRVAGEGVANDTRTILKTTLIEAARRSVPEAMRERVISDLENGLRLTAFVPHRGFEGETLGSQDVTFAVRDGKFMINNAPYKHDRIDRALLLGTSDRWTLRSEVASHPFHIHVNPFQIESIRDESGKDVSIEGEPGDPQYKDLKGVWKDTLFVKQGYTIDILTRYERYVGQFVLHCHILDHEDQGMMQNVTISVPDGEGGAVPLGHEHPVEHPVAP